MTKSLLKRFARSESGSVAIETAFIVPILATMVLGGLEVSNIVSRQTELQTAAAEAAAIAVARPPEDADERAILEGVIEASTGLAADQVTLELRFRCDTSPNLIENSDTCGTSSVVSEFVIITMQDTYTPTWTQFGVGGPVNYNVTRRVQLS